MENFIVRSANELLWPLAIARDGVDRPGQSLHFFTNETKKKKESKEKNSHNVNPEFRSEVSSQQSFVKFPATSSKNEGGAALGDLCLPRKRKEVASQRKPQTSRFKNTLTERSRRTLIENMVLVHDFLEVVDKHHMI